MLPRLEAHKLNTNQPLQSFTIMQSTYLAQSQSPESMLPNISRKGQLPTVPEAEQVAEDSLKAFHSKSKSSLPLLPISNNKSAQAKSALRPSEPIQQNAARQSLQQSLDHGSEFAAPGPVPHYAIPQDRTPLWSERDRPGRFTPPRNPYKQSLDIAPKVNPTSPRFSSPAKYGRSSELLLGCTTLQSPLRSPRQRLGHGQEQQHLTPLSPSDIAPADSLKQASKLSCNKHLYFCLTLPCLLTRLMMTPAARTMLAVVQSSPEATLHPVMANLQGQLLASVNDSLEALGLPRGSFPAPLSRGQKWLSAHGLSTGAPTDTIPSGSVQLRRSGLELTASPRTSPAEVVSSIASQTSVSPLEPAVFAAEPVYRGIDKGHDASINTTALVTAESIQQRQSQLSDSQGHNMTVAVQAAANCALYHLAVDGQDVVGVSTTLLPLGSDAASQAESELCTALTSQPFSHTSQPLRREPETFSPGSYASNPLPLPVSPAPQTLNPELLSSQPQSGKPAHLAVAAKLNASELDEFKLHPVQVSSAADTTNLLVRPDTAVQQGEGVTQLAQEAIAFAEPDLGHAGLHSSSTDIVMEHVMPAGTIDMGQSGQTDGSISVEGSSMDSADSFSGAESLTRHELVDQSNAESVADTLLWTASCPVLEGAASNGLPTMGDPASSQGQAQGTHVLHNGSIDPAAVLQDDVIHHISGVNHLAPGDAVEFTGFEASAGVGASVGGTEGKHMSYNPNTEVQSLHAGVQRILH